MFLHWYAAEREEMREGRRIVTALIKAEKRKKRKEKKRSRIWAKKYPVGGEPTGRIMEMDDTEIVSRKGAAVNG